MRDGGDRLAGIPSDENVEALCAAFGPGNSVLREVFRALVEGPAFRATTVIAISAYLGLWLLPEPIFSKAAAIFTTVGLVTTVGVTAAEIIALARAWHRLREESGKARHIDDLDAAAARFGRTVGTTGAKILLALTTLVGVMALSMTGQMTGQMTGRIMGGASTQIVPGWRARDSVAALRHAPAVLYVDRATGHIAMIPGAMAMAAMKADGGGYQSAGKDDATKRAVKPGDVGTYGQLKVRKRRIGETESVICDNNGKITTVFLYADEYGGFREPLFEVPPPTLLAAVTHGFAICSSNEF